MKNLAIRVALVALAALVLAWLVVGMRAVRLEDQAEAVIDRARAGPVPDAEVRRARERLRQADDLSPDKRPQIMEGQLLAALGRGQEAVFFAHMVTVEEPDNLQAWFLAWTAESKRKAKRQALDQLRRLNPYIDVALKLRLCPDCPLFKKR